MGYAKILRSILDILLPPSEDEKRVRTLTIPHLHTLLAPQKKGPIETLFRYKDPAIRILIWQAKYKNDEYAAELLGTILHEVIFSSLHTPHLLIPIPLASARLKDRGFNQVSRIASSAIRGMASIELCEDILVRTENRTPQTKLEKKARLHNLDSVFKVDDPNRLKGKNIILLDDVMTTGTTLKQARKEILKAGPANVYCIALAH